MLTTILTILGGLVPLILSNAGIIGPGYSNLIANLLGPVMLLLSRIGSGTSKTEDALAVLAMMTAAIAVLKKTPNMPADLLTQINNIDLDVQAALAKYAIAEKGLDLTLYAQIAPVA